MGKIGQDELRRIFGDTIPIEAVQTLWDADESKTIEDIRAEITALAGPHRLKRQVEDILEEGAEDLAKAVIHVVLQAALDAPVPASEDEKGGVFCRYTQGIQDKCDAIAKLMPKDD